MNKKVVISGAPGTGKTSIIEELSKRGYTCHPEISREIIKEQIATKGFITPWQDLIEFSNIVIKQRKNQYHQATSNLDFFDRGIIDAIAYLNKENTPIKKEWQSIANHHKYYEKVFITPPWKEIYVNDNERKEDFESTIEIHQCMINAYESFNYKVIIVPKMSINDRLNFILKEIE